MATATKKVKPGHTVLTMPTRVAGQLIDAFESKGGATSDQAKGKKAGSATPLQKRIAAEARALLTRQAAADLFQMSVAEWIRMENGAAPQAVTVGGRKLWRLADLEKWAAGGCRSRVGKGKTPHPEILRRANLTSDEIDPGLSAFYAAKLCGMSEIEFRNSASAGVAPAPRVLSGGRERWSEVSLRKWIADGCKPTSAKTP